MSLEDAFKNTVIMSMVIAMSHLLIKSMIDGETPSRETFAPCEDTREHRPSLRQQKRDELLKFVLEESAPPPQPDSIPPQNDNYLRSRDETFCSSIKRQPTEPTGIVAFNDFSSDFSSINFSS
jgi:hypothetical protein